MRTDEHKPSAIIPEDYEFVANEFLKVESLGDALVIKAEREKIQAHMARTKGTYSQHEHGGNCMVCGSVNAVYTLLFYYAKTNTYVRMGSECAGKVYVDSDFGHSSFRSRVEDARQALAGKRKAQALLSDAGLSEAWKHYAGEIAYPDGPLPYEERTIIDIVSKFVRYGSISEKAQGYLRKLVESLPDRDKRNAERIAQREAERLTAEDCPKGRVKIEGVILKTDTRESIYGITEKMLVKSDKGFRVWSTIPAAMPTPERGSRVVFVATLEPSQDDPQLGFAKRPTVPSH